MKRKLWIRPVFKGATLQRLVVTTTNLTVLMDEQIVAIYEPETTGKDIKADFPNNDVRWGHVL